MTPSSFPESAGRSDCGCAASFPGTERSCPQLVDHTAVPLTSLRCIHHSWSSRCEHDAFLSALALYRMRTRAKPWSHVHGTVQGKAAIRKLFHNCGSLRGFRKFHVSYWNIVSCVGETGQQRNPTVKSSGHCCWGLNLQHCYPLLPNTSLPASLSLYRVALHPAGKDFLGSCAIVTEFRCYQKTNEVMA